MTESREMTSTFYCHLSQRPVEINGMLPKTYIDTLKTKFEKYNRLVESPEKLIPLFVDASKYPHGNKKLKNLVKEGFYDLLDFPSTVSERIIKVLTYAIREIETEKGKIIDILETPEKKYGELCTQGFLRCCMETLSIYEKKFRKIRSETNRKEYDGTCKMFKLAEESDREMYKIRKEAFKNFMKETAEKRGCSEKDIDIDKAMKIFEKGVVIIRKRK